jgi:hypothetical protein
MPAGKGKVTGGLVDRPHLEWTAVRGHMPTGARRGFDLLGDEALDVFARRVTASLTFFLGAHAKAEWATATERSAILNRVRTAAKRLLLEKQPSRPLLLERRPSGPGRTPTNWRWKFREAVHELDLNGRSALHRAMMMAGQRAAVDTCDLYKLLHALDHRADLGGWPTVCLEAAVLFASVRGAQDAPDPVLRHLVADLAPIWEATTGYSPQREPSVGRNDEDDYREHKEMPFAIWLLELVTAASKLSQPPVKIKPPLTAGSIRDALRATKI